MGLDFWRGLAVFFLHHASRYLLMPRWVQSTLAEMTLKLAPQQN